MLVELIKNGYGNEQKLNCAQKILHASNEAYQLNLSEDALSLAGGFGGGMAVESTCGVITAGVMVLSSLFPAKDEISKKILYGITKDFIETYRQKMGAIDCAPLKKMYRTEDTGCQDVIVEAAIILDQIIQKHQ